MAKKKSKVSKIISQEVAKGHSQKQAVAIAMSETHKGKKGKKKK